MSDRLTELRRQRALMQEHLAWLDREIAAASPGATVSGEAKAASAPPQGPLAVPPIQAEKPTPGPSSHPPAPASPGATNTSAAPEIEIPVEFQHEPGALQSDVRKGCLLYFIAAFAVIVIGIAILYFAFKR